MIYTDIIRSNFVKAKNRPVYYVTINDKNLVPFILRRDGLFSHSMIGESGRLQYFHSKSTAIAFSEVFILGHIVQSCGHGYRIIPSKDSVSVEVKCQRTQSTIQSNIFIYPSNKTLLSGYQRAFYSGYYYEEIIKKI